MLITFYRCGTGCFTRRSVHELLLVFVRKGVLIVGTGKADTVEEQAFLTARREAFEEIGLPMADQQLPKGYSVEHLTELPCNLAITELGVKPCVAYIHAPGQDTGSASEQGGVRVADPARDLLPTLEVKEVAALFTAPFRNFLHKEDVDVRDREVEGQWHIGFGRSWLEEAWRVHQFFVPVTEGRVVRGGQVEQVDDGSSEGPPAQVPEDTPLHMRRDPRTAQAGSAAVDPLQQARYRVYGLTADILVDCARIAYGQEPDFVHKHTVGDEDLIGRLLQLGKLGPIRGKKDLLTRELMEKASKL